MEKVDVNKWEHIKTKWLQKWKEDWLLMVSLNYSIVVYIS